MIYGAANKNLEKKIKISDSYRIRQMFLIALDFILTSIVLMISMKYFINIEYSLNKNVYLIAILGATIINAVMLWLFNAYNSLWRYAGIDEIISIVTACLLSSMLNFIMATILRISIPVGLYILNCILIISCVGGVRIGYRVIRRIRYAKTAGKDASRILIIGAGSAGGIVINELRDNPQINKKPICILDDDKNKIGRRIKGIPIVGKIDEISDIVFKYEIDEIIFAIADINIERKKEIINKCSVTKCKLKTIPGIYEILDGKVNIKKIRDVEIEDLLGREPINVDLDKMSDYIDNKVILVTGGGGSIGSELCRQIATFNPKQLIILDNYENNAYAIQQELLRKYKDELKIKTIIASIREIKRMDKIFSKYRPDVVFHAAAHKHVPLMENSPGESVKNNIFGTCNVANLAHKYEVKRFVLISTDKAVNPTNIMGATKRAAEIIIQTLNKKSETEFVAVRFGNVLGSNGSVIPLFKKQIEEGGPITVTHPKIIRYFMTIPEAVQLVIQAGAMARGGEIFILDMGDPVKIVDLAENLIRLSGLKPGVDIKIEFSGLRPGEKLYEELLMAEEGLTETIHKKIFIAKPMDINEKELIKNLEILRNIVSTEDLSNLEYVMKNIVTTYRKEGESYEEHTAG